MPFRWTCPYCSMVQTVVNAQLAGDVANLEIAGQAEGKIALEASAIGCSNPECGRTMVSAVVGPAQYVASRGTELIANREPLFSQRLLPQGTAKPQPEFIPQALRDDYYEACLIRELSPKASATLIRRCLQGMIRDFAGISKARLVDEI